MIEGSENFYEARLLPLLEDQIIVNIRNITDLKLSEKELITYRHHLEKLVKDRTAELTITNEQLKQEITDRKQAEEALSEMEGKYRILVKNTNDAIFIAQDEVIKFPNLRTVQMLGYSAEELIFIPFVSLIHPEYRDRVLENHRRRLAGEKVPSTHSFKIINRKGEKLWVQLNVVLVKWEGRPATLNFLRDITQQKRLEDQLQRAIKMEAIGTLAGGVAHDLNNILSGIVSYPELLLMQIPEDSPLRRPLSTIQESGKKAATIVQDLLTLARRGVVTREVVNLNDIISDYLISPEHEKILLYHQGVTVETNLKEDLLNISGSPVHLSKTLMNLVSNAVEAMTAGGRMLITTENSYIDRPLSGYDSIEEGDI